MDIDLILICTNFFLFFSKKFVVVRSWKDVLKMTSWITLLHTVLVAPHSKLNEKFAFNILHKFIMLLLMTSIIYGCKNIKVPLGTAKVGQSKDTEEEEVSSHKSSLTPPLSEDKKEL